MYDCRVPLNNNGGVTSEEVVKVYFEQIKSIFNDSQNYKYRMWNSLAARQYLLFSYLIYFIHAEMQLMPCVLAWGIFKAAFYKRAIERKKNCHRDSI